MKPKNRIFKIAYTQGRLTFLTNTLLGQKLGQLGDD
jgi:hypothetical protein